MERLHEPGCHPRANAWSGIHTRSSAEIISRQQRVDGLIIWDMVCGTIGRPCPKLAITPQRTTVLGAYTLPPPCIYVFPATIPSPRNNPHPVAQALDDVQFLKALNDCFNGVQHQGADTVRSTCVRRGGVVQQVSNLTAIRRT